MLTYDTIIQAISSVIRERHFLHFLAAVDSTFTSLLTIIVSVIPYLFLNKSHYQSHVPICTLGISITAGAFATMSNEVSTRVLVPVRHLSCVPIGSTRQTISEWGTVVSLGGARSHGSEPRYTWSSWRLDLEL